MNDLLVDIGKNKIARKFSKNMGIPIPPILDRSSKPWSSKPLLGKHFAINGGGELADLLADGVKAAGGTSVVQKEESLEPVKPVKVLVYDATTVSSTQQLDSIFKFLKVSISKMINGGRVLIFARPPRDITEPEASACSYALQGFVKSLAKEIGKRGASANLVYVTSDATAEKRTLPVLEFLSSEKAAFISGQVFKVTAQVDHEPELKLSGSLAGKLALVTGASRGIGAAIAQSLASEGAHVICLDIPQSDEKLTKTAHCIEGSPLLQDISAPDSHTKIEEFIKHNFSKLDILIHNAGITRDKSFKNMTDEQWESTIDINFASVMRITNHLLNSCINDDARIVCLSSIAGIAGNFGQTNYSTSKSGVIGYVEALSNIVASRGITVNAIAPGFIETDMTAKIPLVTRQVARRMSNFSQGGLPEDIAETIRFLASPASVGVTGSVIRVCGGHLVGA